MNNTTSNSKSVSISFDNSSMLKKPEPLKFTTHRLGMKGSTRRRDIYEGG